MKNQDIIAVRHDDLELMISAIENMLRSLNLLGSSIAGMIPEHILPAHLPLIAGNMISYCFPDIPYNIYTDRPIGESLEKEAVDRAEEYNSEKETVLRRFLMFIPAIPSLINDSVGLTYIELRSEGGSTLGETLLELSFSETVIDSEKKRIAEKWERLPESFKTDVTYSFRSTDESKSLIFIPAK